MESSVAPDFNEEFNPLRFLALHLKEFNEIRLKQEKKEKIIIKDQAE